MALFPIPIYPSTIHANLWAGLLGAGASFTLDNAADAHEVIFQAEASDTITHVWLGQTTVTGTAPTYKVSIQGVNTSGNPDGTILGGGSPASTTFTPVGGGDGTGIWHELDNSIALTVGNFYSIVCAHDSGTIDGSNNCSFRSYNSVLWGLPYPIQNNAGSRTRPAALPSWGIKSATQVYGTPVLTGGADLYSGSSTPDEQALKFRLPARVSSVFDIIGLINPIFGGPGGSHNYHLYRGGDADDTTPIATLAFDCDQYQAANSIRQSRLLFDDALTDLRCGEWARISIEPTSGNAYLSSYTVEDNADLGSMSFPFGTDAYLSTRKGGDWTDVDNEVPLITPIVGNMTGSPHDPLNGGLIA